MLSQSITSYIVSGLSFIKLIPGSGSRIANICGLLSWCLIYAGLGAAFLYVELKDSVENVSIKLLALATVDLLMVLQNICVLPSIAYFVEKSPFLLENHELQRPSHIFLLILNLISNLSPIIYLLPPMFIFQSIFVMLHKLLCFLDIFLVGASAAQSSFNINQYTTEHQEDASEIKVKQLVKEFKEFKDGISPWLFVKFCFTVVNFFISLFSAKNYDFFLFFFPGLFLEMVYIILMLEKSFKVYQSLALKLR